jgi:transcription antitermination factor NusG
VAEKLSKRRIENYCPISRDYKLWNDRRKVEYSPLFSSYVFVRCSLNELLHLKSTDGVINIVYWMQNPVIIRDIEVEMIKRFLHEHPSVYLEKAQVSTNEIVRIVNGPLMEEDGNTIAVTINKTKLILPSLGYSIIADVIKENIEIINLSNSKKKVSKF